MPEDEMCMCVCWGVEWTDREREREGILRLVFPVLHEVTPVCEGRTRSELGAALWAVSAWPAPISSAQCGRYCMEGQFLRPLFSPARRPAVFMPAACDSSAATAAVLSVQQVLKCQTIIHTIYGCDMQVQF